MFLVFGLVIFGFALAFLIAILLVYPNAADLDRGLARLSYGVSGAGFGLLAGVVLAFLLKPPFSTRGAWVALALAAVILAYVSWKASAERAIRNAKNAAADAAARAIPPPLPGGGLDMLRGLAIVKPELLSGFETKEHAYEEKAVTVYGRLMDWYLVRKTDGAQAWLNKSDIGKYFTVEELMVNRNNYLTGAWDSRIRDTPDESQPARTVKLAAATRKEIPAKVLEAREAGGMSWLRVEILEQSPCEGGTPKVIASGWIPTWGDGQHPSAWFYSRGC